jgi:hypothetical protein
MLKSKKVSIRLSLEEWKLLKNDSLSQEITMTKLIRNWIVPKIRFNQIRREINEI